MDISLIKITDWLRNNVFTSYIIIQAVILLLISIISYFISGAFKKDGLKDKVSKIFKYLRFISRDNLNRVIVELVWPIIGAALIWLYILFAVSLEYHYQFLMSVGHLINAWIIIKIFSSFMKSKIFTRFLSVFVWIIAALKIMNVYDKIVNYLSQITFSIGDYTVSLTTIIKSVIIISILIYIADKISDLLDRKINNVESMTPAARILTRKFSRIFLMIIAGLIGLSTLGIDLTAFAFIGGTLGVGLGFGLQKVVSNFVSGIIILADKSVKPGDVIEINENYGYINSLGTRFVSLITRGGKEFLIPNEDFITQTVVNWSYSDRMVRIDVPIGISYNSDLRGVIKLIQDSIKDIDRIMQDPEPKCIVKEFGESSIDLIFRFWISDPDHGVANVKSEVLLLIWDVFKENDIEIPYPQRDLHIIKEKDVYGEKEDNNDRNEENKVNINKEENKNREKNKVNNDISKSRNIEEANN
ncbi:MAG: mechanosensitive ion channel family protein [bacterium]